MAKRRAAASCSTIAVPMSMDGRTAAMVASVLRSARIQPIAQAAPERFRHRPDRQHQVASGRHEGSHRRRHRPVQPHVGDRLVDDCASAGFGDDGAEASATRLGKRHAGGIVVVEDQVGQVGGELTHRGMDSRRVPSLRRSWRPAPVVPRGRDGRQRAVVGGLLDQHPIAGLGVGGQNQSDRVQRARRHHDLVGLGG